MCGNICADPRGKESLVVAQVEETGAFVVVDCVVKQNNHCSGKVMFVLGVFVSVGFLRVGVPGAI